MPSQVEVRRREITLEYIFLLKLEFQYCMKSKTKLYLERHFKTKSELYALYKVYWCVIRLLRITTFPNTVEVCIGFRTKNIDQPVFNEHVLKNMEHAWKKREVKILKSSESHYHGPSICPFVTEIKHICSLVPYEAHSSQFYHFCSPQQKWIVLHMT